ncbi:MAG: hypothetical protein IT376_10620 [Polyangiaceae bacterium]|nr:hypothetical protein [Polyangiaceae bacterium]
MIEWLIDGRDRRGGKRRDGVLERPWVRKDELRIAAELAGAGAPVARHVYGSRSGATSAPT